MILIILYGGQGLQIVATDYSENVEEKSKLKHYHPIAGIRRVPIGFVHCALESVLSEIGSRYRADPPPHTYILYSDTAETGCDICKDRKLPRIIYLLHKYNLYYSRVWTRSYARLIWIVLSIFFPLSAGHVETYKHC